MVRLLYCLRRRTGVALDEFHAHWLEHHVEQYGRPIRTIRRYVLYAALETQPADGTRQPPYDGVATVWFDDAKALIAAMDTAMPEAAIDEQRFIDHDRSRAMLVDDHVIVEPDAPAPIVLFECLRRAADTPPAEFARAWLAHGERARHAYADGLLHGYIQSHAISDPEGGLDRFDALGAPTESWDGIGAAYFQSALLARRYLQANGGLPTGGQARFVDHRSTVSMLARRHPRRDLIR